MQGPPPIIRHATPADLEGIFSIYDPEVLRGTATFETTPKSPDERRAWLDHHHAPRHPVLVSVNDAGAVLGWASLSEWSERCAYARAAEVSVYVRADQRGRGVGKALLGALADGARRAGLGVLLARIVEGNPASRKLHESVGFTTIGVMRRVGEKFGRILDVRLMELHLDGR